LRKLTTNWRMLTEEKQGTLVQEMETEKRPGPFRYYFFFGGIGVAMAAYLTWYLYTRTLWRPYTAWLAAVNATALALYGMDKFLSPISENRVPENVLLAIPLLGGVVGTFLAMVLLPHKIGQGKARFRVVLAIAAGLHLGIAFWVYGLLSTQT
jgi:uncharacterized membrane protein YsdA (DUF1294 family)